MEKGARKKFFVNPAEVRNRSQKSVEFADSAGFLTAGGCDCVNCRSCDNSCNK